MSTPRSLCAYQRTLEQTLRVFSPPLRIQRQPAVRAFHISPQRKHIPSTPLVTFQVRYSPTEAHEEAARQLTDRESTSQSDADTIAVRKALSPAYRLTFTCKRCLEPSGHTISKQAYHFGTCVIHCPTCKSQHLISDNLKIFSDRGMTLEEIAKEHGEKLKKGRLGVDGDVEFYDDSTNSIVEEGEVKKLAKEELAERISRNAKRDMEGLVRDEVR